MKRLINEDEEILITPSNFKSLVDLMDRADEFDMPLFGENESGETTITSINDDNVIIETIRGNGWVMKDIFRRDGTEEHIVEH